MDKNIIRKFAVWARTELIHRVEQKAAQFGFSPNHDFQPNRVLSAHEQKQYCALEAKIRLIGYQQTIEEAAYTWFNRFCALRFMEVNGYLPSHIRVFTDENNEYHPQILAEAIHLADKFENIDMNRVFELINANSKEELYRYLLITQCNALKTILPGMFTKLEDDTELLFPDNILNNTSVVAHLISDIPESYFSLQSNQGQIEIIGWLYQYYISEKREEVIDPLHGKEIKREDIPAATQVFTTEWVVRYITDNAIGRYWLDHYPQSNIADELTYYIHHTPQSKGSITPQDLTVLDPCVGSGHFLVYAIDILIKIYREYGYSDRDAISDIITHNLYGLDIDGRASQLAYFALMMKGCQYDKRFLKRGIQPHIYIITDSQFADDNFIQYFCQGNKILLDNLTKLFDAMKSALESGSLTQLPALDFDKLARQIEKLNIQKNLFHYTQLQRLKNLLNVARTLSSKYTAVITNPPYLNKYDPELKNYLLKNYKDYSGDLFSAFIYQCTQFCKPGGYTGLMTPNVWMFIKSYKKLRQYLLTNHSITTLVQMAKGAFFSEATVDVCAFVIQCQNQKQDGIYFRLEDFTGNMDYQNEKLLEALNNPNCPYRYHAASSLFQALPGMPIGYWAGENILHAFQTGIPLTSNAAPRQGLATTDNHKYLRYWYEVDLTQIGFGLDRKTATTSDIRWFPYNKGGEFRKWYGNQDYIVNYQHNGAEIKHDVLTKYPYLKTPNFVVKNPETYFSPSLSWSKISSGSVAFRYFPQGFLYDVSGCSIFFNHENDLFYHAGFLNSIVCKKMLEIISPTLNYEAGQIALLPIIQSELYKERVVQLVKNNIELSKIDWNQQETSWDFYQHPLISHTETLISDQFQAWKEECHTRFQQLKENEEELNRIFIDIYDLQNDLRPEIEDKIITIRQADLTRDIKSLISYAVGCMFGRYSLAKGGLCYTGGKFDDKFITIKQDNAHQKRCYWKEPDADHCADHFGTVANNIIPITDNDYFEDDIANQFFDFIRIVYGEKTLDSNLKFIADALGGKGTPREIIRAYFLNDFYADHLKLYQKRPIYWLFRSGQYNGFQCLIYMHRYQPDAIARIRIDYVLELQSRYLTATNDIETRLQSASDSEAVKLKSLLTRLKSQTLELLHYEEKIHHLADQMLSIDLNDGVKYNYAKFSDILATIK